MIPKRFNHPSEVIASYDYTQLATGLGLIDFYCSTTLSGSTVGRVLSDATLPTDDPTSTGGSHTNDTQIDTFDFDTTSLNYPVLMQGTGYLDLKYKIGIDGEMDTISLSGTLYKYDGSTYTQIAASTKAARASHPFGDSDNVLPLDIPLTKFNPGDKIRLSITIRCTETGTGTAQTWLYNDPETAAKATKVVLPFKIDL